MHRSRRWSVVCLGLVLAATLLPADGVGAAAPDLLLILDASGSMWGQIEGENKIVIARRVLKDLLGELPEGAEVGLVVYGHRRGGDCDDVETVVPLGPLDRGVLGTTIDGLNPKGKTPITTAIVQAVEVVRGRDAAATVVLVSDGLETCGGDPCRAVREAKEAGVELVLHVVGFDVAGENVSQLECAAQAGGGLFWSAEDAAELAAALDQAVAAPAQLPSGRLSVAARADGALVDAVIEVTADGSDVAYGRTYGSAETNPRVLPVPGGTYDVEVRPVGIEGAAPRRFTGVAVAEGETVEKVADFSTGELAVGVTRNGELSDAVVRIYAAGTSREVGGGRTYVSASSNPLVTRLAAGTYDVEVGSVEIAGKPSHRFEGVEVEPRGRAERSHEFKSGTLTVGAVAGDELVDAVVGVYSRASGRETDRGRTYTSAGSNPRTFTLPPGGYRVTLKAVGLEGRPSKEIEVTVEAGGEVERQVDFGE